MKAAGNTIIYDEDLRIEACRFQGMARPFPPHFHGYYVIGLVESGERRLSCRDQEIRIYPGCVLLFHPGDSHGCVQTDGGTLDYRSFHIEKEVMAGWMQRLTGMGNIQMRQLPGFSQTVIEDEGVAEAFRALHERVMDRCPWVQTNERSKEDAMLHLITLLRDCCGRAFPSVAPSVEPEGMELEAMELEAMELEAMELEAMEHETMEPETIGPETIGPETMEPEAMEAWGSVVEQACSFLEQHYAEHISLDQLCRRTGVSKSTLLRAFSKGKGISPYGYLETVRIGAAKKLLEQGLPPVEVALRTGFSDQSHLTNSFSRFLGVAPGAYRDIFLKDLKA